MYVANLGQFTRKHQPRIVDVEFGGKIPGKKKGRGKAPGRMTYIDVKDPMEWRRYLAALGIKP